MGQQRWRRRLGRSQLRRWLRRWWLRRRRRFPRRWRTKIGLARSGASVRRQVVLANTHRNGPHKTTSNFRRTAMLMVAPNRRTGTSRLWTMAVVFGVLLPLVACNTPKAPVPSEAGPKTFATPDDAGATLLAATKTGNRDALIAIFGPGASDLIFSGDAAQDKLTFEHFTSA